MTCHRPSNVDYLDRLEELIKTISLCSKDIKIIFPLHPRTKKSIIKNNLWDSIKDIKNLIITDSLGYLDFMHLVFNSQIIITDSGGIQEETCFLQIPCLTVRENTERPVTISMGSNELINLNSKLIHHKMLDKLQSNNKGIIPPLWDGLQLKE